MIMDDDDDDDDDDATIPNFLLMLIYSMYRIIMCIHIYIPFSSLDIIGSIFMGRILWDPERDRRFRCTRLHREPAGGAGFRASIRYAKQIQKWIG